jgi:NAD(P)H-hydrate epimerase
MMTRAQVRAFDKFAIELLGIPSIVLMENAGRGVVDVLRSLKAESPFIILCGKGNNGGDGLVIARHLAKSALDVRVFLFAEPDALSPDAGIQWNIVQKMGLKTDVGRKLDKSELTKACSSGDWIIDALFGTGLDGPVKPPFDDVIEIVNQCKKRVLAVDIPSGLDADTGEPLGPTVRAQHTVTFVDTKEGFANPKSAEYTGSVHIASIGVAPSFVSITA